MNRRLDPMLVLQARLEARAQLFKLGNYADEHDMMAPLYEYAQRMKLFDKLGGVDGIDGMMLHALENEKAE